jgi:uncharacterized protein YjbI with pentapeptide repeats
MIVRLVLGIAVWWFQWALEGNMANEEHLAILRQGVGVWNEWREKNADVIPDLSYAELGGIALFRAGPEEAGLTEICLSEARPGATDFSYADLSQADLNGVTKIHKSATS